MYDCRGQISTLAPAILQAKVFEAFKAVSAKVFQASKVVSLKPIKLCLFKIWSCVLENSQVVQMSFNTPKLCPSRSKAMKGGPMEDNTNADVATDGHSDRKRDVRRRRR